MMIMIDDDDDDYDGDDDDDDAMVVSIVGDTSRGIVMVMIKRWRL